MLFAQAGEQQVARLVQRRLAPVDEEARPRPSSRCRARAWSGCSSRRRSRGRRAQASRGGGSARARSCTCSTTSASPLAPASAVPPSPRLHCRISASPRTARIASVWERACTPAPRIATVRAPGRASARVATAETAAVRISVIGEAFRIACNSPVSPSWRSTAPWCASSPRVGVVRNDHDLLQRPRRVLSAPVGGHEAHQVARARRAREEAERLVQLPTCERAQHLLHGLDALVHRQQPADVVLADDEDAHAKSPVSSLPLRRRESQVERLERRGQLLLAGAARRSPPSPSGRPAATRSRVRPATSPARGRAPRTPRARRRPGRPGSGGRDPAGASSAIPAGACSPRRYFPVSQAARERAVRRVAEPFADADPERLLLVVALEQRVRVLRPVRPACASAASSHAASTLLPPYARIFPSSTSSAKGADGLGDRHLRIHGVREIERYGIHAEARQAPQRSGGGSAQARDPAVRAFGHRVEGLRRQDDPLAHLWPLRPAASCRRTIRCGRRRTHPRCRRS